MQGGQRVHGSVGAESRGGAEGTEVQGSGMQEL